MSDNSSIKLTPLDVRTINGIFMYNNDTLLSKPNTHTEAVYHMYGTIGVIGSGADYETSSLGIVAGQEYSLRPFNATVPTEFP